MYKMVQKLTPDDVCVIAKQLYIDMLKGGYSQVAIFSSLGCCRIITLTRLLTCSIALQIQVEIEKLQLLQRVRAI